MNDEEYFHALDSLVRFYNSEFLAHIGYELTSLGVMAAAASITVSTLAGAITHLTT